MNGLEKLLLTMCDMQDMVFPDDELTNTIEQTKKEAHAEPELDEDELEMVWAAKQELRLNKKDDY